MGALPQCIFPAPLSFQKATLKKKSFYMDSFCNHSACVFFKTSILFFWISFLMRFVWNSTVITALLGHLEGEVHIYTGQLKWHPFRSFPTPCLQHHPASPLRCYLLPLPVLFPWMVMFALNMAPEAEWAEILKQMVKVWCHLRSCKSLLSFQTMRHHLTMSINIL